MAKKQINQSAMDALMGGLASTAAPASSPASSNPAPTVMQPEMKKTRICTMVEENVWNKVMCIARRENIPINHLVTYGLSLAVKQYEAKHGEIKARNQAKGTLSSIFD